MFIAFVIIWIGFWMMFTAWRDHTRSMHGAPVRKLDDATRAAIRSAVEQGDVVAAIKLYRRAVPEAALLEAREHAAIYFKELRAKNPASFAEAYANPWRALRVRPSVLAATDAIFTALVLLQKPAEAAQVVWYFLGGVLYGIVAMVSPHLRGVLVKVLMLAGCAIAVFTGGNILFEKQLPGHIWLLLAGLVTSLVVLNAGRQRKKA